MPGTNPNATELRRPPPAGHPALAWLRAATTLVRRRWPAELVRHVLVGCRYSMLTNFIVNMLIDFIVNLFRLRPDLELAALKACQIILLTCGGPDLPAPLKQEQARCTRVIVVRSCHRCFLARHARSVRRIADHLRKEDRWTE